MLANSVAMTVFTGHMTVFVLAMAVARGFGVTLLSEPNAKWWLERPLWLAIPGVMLAGLIAVFARVEQRATRSKSAFGAAR